MSSVRPFTPLPFDPLASDVSACKNLETLRKIFDTTKGI